MNVVALRGTLSSAPVTRALPSGEELVAFQVTVRPPTGPAESIPVSWLGAPAPARRLPPGTEVVVTGRVRRRFFRAGTATASRTEVVAEAVVPVRQAARAARALARVAEGLGPEAAPH